MDRWAGRVALVTGASSGIGAAISTALVHCGFKVVGASRKVEEIQALTNSLKGEPGTLTAIKCDLTKDDEIESLFRDIKRRHGGVDVCVNNAGGNIPGTLLGGNTTEWRNMLDLNIVALSLCSKLAVESMRERGVDDGHIINISSLVGHIVFNIPTIHFYTGSKYFVQAVTEGLRQEMRGLNSHIRVSAISPGMVATGFKIANDITAIPGGEALQDVTLLRAEDIAASVLHILSSPPHVEINDIVIRPTNQPL